MIWLTLLFSQLALANYSSTENSIWELVDFLDRFEGHSQFYNCQIEVQTLGKCSDTKTGCLARLYAYNRVTENEIAMQIEIPPEQLQSELRQKVLHKLYFSNAYSIKDQSYVKSVFIKKDMNLEPIGMEFTDLQTRPFRLRSRVRCQR